MEVNGNLIKLSTFLKYALTKVKKSSIADVWLGSKYVSVSRTLHLTFVNPLSANPTKWSNTLKHFVGKLPTNCLSVFDLFVGLELKGLKLIYQDSPNSEKIITAN